MEICAMKETSNGLFNNKQTKKIEDYCNAVFDGLRGTGAKQRVQDPNRNGREVNLQGMAAEIWFKEKHNIPYSLEPEDVDVAPRSYLHDVDVLIDGKVFELKQTSYDTGCLFLNHIDWYGKPKKLIADIYVLVIGKFPNYDRELYITREESILINPEARMHKLIGKVGLFAEQSDMHSTLKEALDYNVRNNKGSSTLS